ncbi:MAG: serine hydrolase [Bacteroidetes bacterium]|nr:serine hydrolase [Bacteroidota bacterium]
MLEKSLKFGLFFLFLGSVSCSSSNQPGQPVAQVTPADLTGSENISAGLPQPEERPFGWWSDSVFKTLSVRQKVGQLIFPRTNAHYFAEDSKSYIRIKKLINSEEIGGVVVFQGDVMEEATVLNEWQSESKLPLWVMQDTENGLAMRTRNATLFPHIMSLGAINDTTLTRKYAKVIALENRAVGVHHALAPVVDVNNNAENPVINVRSFGADPELVGNHGLSYVRGTEQGGQIATLKHFPGHGDTGTDSHVDIPVLPYLKSRLDSVELKPYKMILSASNPSVMIGHLALPKITGNYEPATLSGNLLNSILFGELSFRGLVVSDAMDMGAIVKNYGNVKAVIKSIDAGVHCIILPVGEEQVIDGVVQAIAAGDLNQAKVDSACLRILRLKEQFSLNKNRYSDIRNVRKVVATGEHLALAEEVANRSLTLLKNDNKIVPFSGKTSRRLLMIILSENQDPATGDILVKSLRQTSRKVEAILLDKGSNSLDYDIATKRLNAYSEVILVSHMNTLSSKGKTSFGPEISDWLSKNKSELIKKKTISIVLGNPYVVNALDFSDAVICTYSVSDNSQRAVVAALNGEIQFEGRLPVSLIRFKSGSGIVTGKKTGNELQMVACETDLPEFYKLKTFVEESILEGVAPGMAVSVVGLEGVVFQKTFGKFTYETTSPSVQCSTLYDLASLTKVLATTLSLMKLYDQNRLNLDSRLTDFFPEISDSAKKKITLRNLLTHTSGFESWRPFHLLGEPSKTEIINTILNAKLAYQPGDSSIYSDWNFILLAQIVEKISGLPLDQFAYQEIYSPLNLKNTLFNPSSRELTTIAPTEIDSVWRKRLVQGTVHDETAQLLGGVSGHAGLFSTIQDVSVIVQMLLNKGEYRSSRVFSPETIDLFTKLSSGKDLRGLGWDIKSPKGYTSAGTLMGSKTYGHLGFTGTSLWIDPEMKIGVVVLSNRVYPTRANKKISAFRPKIYDLAIEGVKKIRK